MSFEQVQFTVSLVVLVVVGWIGFTVKNLKSITDSLKNVFDSMKSSSDFLQTVHKAASSLYDPAEIEKIVNLRVDVVRQELTQSIAKLQSAEFDAREEVGRLKAEQQVLIENMEPLTREIARELVRPIFERLSTPYIKFMLAASMLLPSSSLDVIIGLSGTSDETEDLRQVIKETQAEMAIHGITLPVQLKIPKNIGDS